MTLSHIDRDTLQAGYLGITDKWYAADTGASDAFAHRTPLDKATRTSSVTVTNGGVEQVDENEFGELMVKGTQLLPVGKAARNGLRSFVWIQGDPEPVFTRLPQSEARRIQSVIASQPRLSVRNNIPYCDPNEGLILRKEMRGDAPLNTGEANSAVGFGATHPLEDWDMKELGFTVPIRCKKGPMPILTALGWMRSLIAPYWSDVYTHIRADAGVDCFVGPTGLSQGGLPAKGKSTLNPSNWRGNRKTVLFRRRGPELRFISFVGYVVDDIFDSRKQRNRELTNDFDIDEIPDAPLLLTLFTATSANVHMYKIPPIPKQEVGAEDARSEALSDSAEKRDQDDTPDEGVARSRDVDSPQRPPQSEKDACDYYDIFTPAPDPSSPLGTPSFLAYLDNATPNEDLYRIREAFRGAQVAHAAEVFDRLMAFGDACMEAAQLLGEDASGATPEYVVVCDHCGGCEREASLLNPLVVDTSASFSQMTEVKAGLAAGVVRAPKQGQGKVKKPPKPRRSRILPFCDMSAHSHLESENHITASDPYCDVCQKANLRSAAKKRLPKGIKIGEFGVDLMVRLTEFFPIQFVLVLVSTGKTRKVVVAKAIDDKSAEKIWTGLMSAILIAEHVWGAAPIKRIHSDREAGILAGQMKLSERAIRLTYTEGHASQANAYAESAISHIARGVRSTLESSLNKIVDLSARKIAATFLWHHCAEYVAAVISASEIHSPADEGMREPLLQLKDLTDSVRFLEKVFCRPGPGVKPEQDASVGKSGWYLGPALDVTGASFVMLDDPPYKIVTACTVRPCRNNGLSIYPETLNLPSETVGEHADEWGMSSWIECSKCKKWRLCDTADIPILDTEASPFVCRKLHGTTCKTKESDLAWDRDDTRKPSGKDASRARKANRPEKMANIALLCELLPGVTPQMLVGRTGEAYGAMLDWASEQSIQVASEEEEEMQSWKDGEPPPIDLGPIEWHVEHGPRHADEQVGQENAEAMMAQLPSIYGSFPTAPSMRPAPDFSRTGHLPPTTRATSWESQVKRDYQYYVPREGYVVKVLNIKDAKATRPKYSETVASELKRHMDFSCYGKPVARSTIPDDAIIYRGKLIYGIKHWEHVEMHKDKARLIVQGCLRVTKEGKVMLERYFKAPGEFWAPTSSLAGFRFVCCLAAILGLKVTTIDLDSAYLQSEARHDNTYLQFPPELTEAFTDDWQMAIRQAVTEDFMHGGWGEVVFPLLKNVYGKPDAGTNFINDFQQGTLIPEAGFQRLPHCHGTFLKFCPVTGKPQLISNYVDDICAALTPEDGPKVWAAIARHWKFDPERPLNLFLGVVAIQDKQNRRIILSQRDYLANVVAKHEKWLGKPVRGVINLPQKEPPWPDKTYKQESGTHFRSMIGGLMYAARGTRMDIAKAVNVCARRCVSWNQECTTFMNSLIGYVKGTLEVVLTIDASGQSFDLADWGLDISNDADHNSPSCQSGLLLTIAPHAQGDGDCFLALDWSSTHQVYAKLSPNESEIVTAVHGQRVGLRYASSWEDICSGPLAAQRLEKEEVNDSAERPRCLQLTQREDNQTCILTLSRGWSITLAHVPRIYAVSLLWSADRIREQRVRLVKEGTSRMLADPLTKLTNPKVLFDRGVLLKKSPIEIKAVA